MSTESHQRLKFNAALDALLAAIRGRAERQFEYNLESNVPSGIVELHNAAAAAVQHGYESGAGHLSNFGSEKQIEIAYNILEDANCHTEAAALKRAAEAFDARA